MCWQTACLYYYSCHFTMFFYDCLSNPFEIYFHLCCKLGVPFYVVLRMEDHLSPNFYGFPWFLFALRITGPLPIFSAAWVLAPPAFQTSLCTTLHLCATASLASFVVLEHIIHSSSPEPLRLLFSFLGIFFFPYFIRMLLVIQAFPVHWR